MFERLGIFNFDPSLPLPMVVTPPLPMAVTPPLPMAVNPNFPSQPCRKCMLLLLVGQRMYRSTCIPANSRNYLFYRVKLITLIDLLVLNVNTQNAA